MLRLAAAALLAALLAAPALAVIPADPMPVFPEGRVPAEIVVGFHGALPRSLDAWALDQGGQLLLHDDAIAWASLRFPTEAAADAAIARALRDPAVRYAEHDAYVSVAQIPTPLDPNDPLYGQQWGPPAIRLPFAWQLQTGNHAVKLAILDTGLYFAHPDIAPNVCGPHASFITGQTVDDGFGHGTHVAGIAAGVTDNGIGIAGASQSCIMVGKVLGNSGSSVGTSVAAGMVWAADNGADIISMSLGRPDLLQTTADAAAYAWGKGVLIIAAAGNNGCGGGMLYPALLDEVVAVAALTSPGLNTASFSSCGPDMEVAAPGEAVLATLPPCTGGVALCSNSLYGSLSGTSMATPYAAGVAALIKAQNPGLTNFELRCALDLSADDMVFPTGAPLMLPGRDERTGWGRVDAASGVALATALTAPGVRDAFTQACTALEDEIMH
ncbi:MAG TPA: S8 family serine peptidase [Candidatus Thermoplasmatota archaeon]|jgi:thermitase|nr:S8 family serine peptidase [Candidatus Thermoplasmatota archaeon]